MNLHSSTSWRLPWLGLVLLFFARPAFAHDGPPYPILVDEELSGYVVSVWADPDVGVGTFFYYIEPPAGCSALDVRLRVKSKPVDGSSPSVQAESLPAEEGEPFQQVGTLEFDHMGQWETNFLLHPVDPGAEPLGELFYELSVTPPGLGTIDLLWFSLPFLAFAGIWIRVLFAKRAHTRALTSATTTRT